MSEEDGWTYYHENVRIEHEEHGLMEVMADTERDPPHLVARKLIFNGWGSTSIHHVHKSKIQRA